jgi:hypothetical protein
VQVELRERARHGRHAGAEFERHAAQVGRPQGAALVRHLGPLRRTTRGIEMGLEPVEILLAEYPHADALACRRLARAAQHQAVVAGLLEAAQVESVGRLLGGDEADDLGIEQPAHLQVLDGQDHMTRARDVERRVVVGPGQVHDLSRHAGRKCGGCDPSAAW